MERVGKKPKDIEGKLKKFGLVVSEGERQGKRLLLKENKTPRTIITDDQMNVLRVFVLLINISETSGVGEADHSQAYEARVPGSYRGTRKGFVEERDIRETIYQIKKASVGATSETIAERVLKSDPMWSRLEGGPKYEAALETVSKAIASKWSRRPSKNKTSSVRRLA